MTVILGTAAQLTADNMAAWALSCRLSETAETSNKTVIETMDTKIYLKPATKWLFKLQTQRCT